MIQEVCGAKVEKPSASAIAFQVFSIIQGFNSRTKLSVTFALRLYNSYNYTVCALGPTPSAPKQWESDVHSKTRR